MKQTFKIHGLDCGEEVAILKRELSPLVGGEDRLQFDTLNGKLIVEVPDGSDLQPDIQKAVAATGMSAQPWSEFCESGVCAVEESFWQRKGRVLFCTVSGGLLAVGLFIHALLHGLPDALVGGDKATLPLFLRGVFLLSSITGAWFILPKAWYSLREFRPDMNLLMTVAVTGAIFLGEWLEAAAVAFLFSLSLVLESWSVGKARRAIESLMALTPLMARIRLDDGSIVERPVEEVPVGARVSVRPGEKIPADGVVIEGSSYVNQAPITGESKLMEKAAEDVVYAGTINGDGNLEVMVSKAHQDTTLAGIIRLVEESQANRSPSEKWVDRFARVYTPVMMILAILVAFIPPLVFGGEWNSWIYEALVILVIACPCALVISTPVSIVAGLAKAARNGVLIKGGVFLEAPSRIKAIAFDKTGTLTVGKPQVQVVVPRNEHDERELLTIAAALEADSTHPLAQAIIQRAVELDLEIVPAQDHTALQGRGATGRIDGDIFWIGSHRLLEESGGEQPEDHSEAVKMEGNGLTVITIFNEKHVCGLIGLADSIRDSAPETIKWLKRLGIKKTVLLTGDNRQTAQVIADLSGVDDFQAELLPEDKVKAVQDLKKQYGSVAMAGDGINDAPAMAATDLGIAMGAIGTDAAIETADVALMSDELPKIAWLIQHSRRTLAIIKQNVIFALGVKAVFLVLAGFQLATLWMAIAADMGASLLVIFNGLRLLSKTSDR